MRRAPAEFRDAGVELPDAPWLGPVTPHEGALVQWLQVRQLLTPELRELLFPAEAA